MVTARLAFRFTPLNDANHSVSHRPQLSEIVHREDRRIGTNSQRQCNDRQHQKMNLATTCPILPGRAWLIIPNTPGPAVMLPLGFMN